MIQFSHIAVLLLAFSVDRFTAQSCPRGVQPRKEVRNLSDQEWNDFVKGVKAMQAGRGPNTWDRYAKMHVDNQATVHGNSFFFPWHRYYLRQLELEIQKTSPSIMLPYWDWAYDSQAPELSPVFSNTRFGKNGENGCLRSGSFANTQVYYPNPHCLNRQWDGGNRISALYSTDVINRVGTSAANNYDTLRRSIEMNPHGAVHVNIGGDMANMWSPNDPIFYVHHAFVDKIWAMWQAKGAGSAYNGVGLNNRPATLNDELPSYPGVKVSLTMDTKNLCFYYAELVLAPPTPAPGSVPPPVPTPGSAPPPTVTRPATPPPPTTVSPPSGVTSQPQQPQQPQQPNWGRPQRPHRWWKRGEAAKEVLIDPNDRQELANLRQPKTLPDQWVTMNHLSVEEVKTQRSSYSVITSEINGISGYIPACTLWLRDDMLKKLVNTTSTFTAIVDGQTITTTVTESTTVDVKEKVSEIKNKVRSKVGGSLRKDPKVYIKKLSSVVGHSLFDSKEASYSITLPNTSPLVKVASFKLKDILG